MNRVLFMIILSFSFVVHSQIKQDTSKKVNTFLLPLIIRSPETGWAIGLSGSVSFKTTPKNDTLTRTSNIQAFGIYTERKQNVEALDATIYFAKNEYVLHFHTSHSFFPDKYWGLGPNTIDYYENYRFEQFHFVPHFKKQIAKKTYVGLLYEFQIMFNMNYAENGMFDNEITYGKDGYHVSGLGGSISYDSRNSGFWPTKGVYLQILSTYFNTYLGSQFNDLKTLIDLRYFKKVFKDHVIAVQLYSYSNSGEAAFRELAMIGGAGNLRGFYQGRYRDNSMITAIAEYRMPIHGLFSACFFGGVGNVYYGIKDVWKITKDLKYSYGGGLRIAILKKEKLNLRLDYGYRDNLNNGFYFTLSECF